MILDTRYSIFDFRRRRRLGTNKYQISNVRYQRGISLIEIAVIIPIVGIAFFSIYQLVSLALVNNEDQGRRVQALALTKDGVELVRVIRDADWSNIDSLTTGANYYLSGSNGAWSLTPTDPGVLEGIFTRTVVFEAVNRDDDDNISETGTADPNTRLLTVTVTWEERGKDREIELQTYLTNFQGT